MKLDYIEVTELSGTKVSQEQVGRLAIRYYWAGQYCHNKDVLEVACGTGQGLGYLANLAKTLLAGDISVILIRQAQAYYGHRITFTLMDAQSLPFRQCSLDIIILFEAIYYLRSAEAFVAECRRVLRPGGKVLVATANKDLYDFSPSPFSYTYYGVKELAQLFSNSGFNCEFFGNIPVSNISLRQRLLRPIKKIIVELNLMPETMIGKTLLRRLVFGRLVYMPAEIDDSTACYDRPVQLAADKPDRIHKVILCAATLDP